MTASKPERRTILTEDGELRDLDSLLNTPDQEQEPVYCTECGTANPPRSNFCRKCGHALQDEAPASGPRKRKNEALLAAEGDLYHRPVGRTSSAINTWTALTRLVRIFFVAGMVITAFAANASWVALPILLFWFLTEAVRGEKHGDANVASFLSEGVMDLFVSGMVAGSLATHNGWMSIFVLLAWFLVEAVRS